MSYRSAVLDRVHFVRWKEPTVRDIDPIVREIRDARLRNGEPLFGIAIAPVDSVPPGDDVRAAWSERLEELLTSVESIHFVIEGSGFRQAIIRSAVTTILFLSKHRGRVFVHQTVEAALTQFKSRLTLPVDELIRRAALLNILTEVPKATERSRAL